MRLRPLQYKIFRQKFWFTVLVTIAASVAVFVGVLSFLLLNWVNTYRADEEASFSIIEQRVNEEATRANDYVLRLYSNRSLTDDLAALFSAREVNDYIKRRGENSLRSPQLIHSIEEDFRLFLTERGGLLTDIVLKTPNAPDKNLFADVSGNMVVFYTTQNEINLTNQLYKGKFLLGTYSVREPGNINSYLGEVQFWAKSEILFRLTRPSQGARAIMSADGKILHSISEKEAELERLEKAQKSTEKHGWLWDDKGFVYYLRTDAYQHNYICVSAITLSQIMASHAQIVWMLFGALVLLNCAVLSFVYSSIKYDAGFLSYTLKIIDCVEKGDFDGAENLPRPRAVRANEYGSIARALENMTRALNHYILIQYRLKLKQQETSMLALQQQINPHFLYNTLEAIRAQALEDESARTADAIALLGALYRDVLRKDEVITLADEFALLEDYLAIMQLRFPENFVYQIELEPELRSVRTVKFWLQPLAENFFNHGFNSDSEFNLIIVSAYPEEGGLHIELIDNGSGVAPGKIDHLNESMRRNSEESGQSIGLRNVFMRLSWFYGEGFSMEVTNNPEGGASIVIHIPDKEDIACTP